MKQEQANMLGVTVSPLTIGKWLNKEEREFRAALLTGLANPHFIILTDAGDGSGAASSDGEVIIGPAGSKITLDLRKVGAGGGSLEFTDGTTDLTGVKKITVSGAVVGGTSAAATLTISAAGLQQFKIVSSGMIDGADYYNCKTWDGTTLGSTVVKVAKQFKMRCTNGPGSDSIRGITYTYTYAVNTPYDEYKRSTSGSDGSASTDYCTPPALAGDIIVAAAFTTATPSTLSAVTWIEITERKWATGP